MAASDCQPKENGGPAPDPRRPPAFKALQKKVARDSAEFVKIVKGN